MPKTEDSIGSDLVGTFTDPIIVYPGGWGDTLPDWLKNAITLERLEINMKALKGDEPTGTDAEACAYLYTAGLTASMGHDWGQIYLYVANKTYNRWYKNEVLEDIRVESLTDEQMRDLNRLKEWILRKRTQARIDKERTESRERKEEEIARREAEQPVLFQF